jgi:hypothetical protein
MVAAQIHEADDRPEPRQHVGYQQLRTETVRWIKCARSNHKFGHQMACELASANVAFGSEAEAHRASRTGLLSVPQPFDEASRKDRLEARICAKVCIDCDDAELARYQAAFAHDWTALERTETAH